MRWTTLGLLVALLGACERPRPETTVEPAAGTAAPGRSALPPELPSGHPNVTPGAGAAGLPPGHPPIEGPGPQPQAGGAIEAPADGGRGGLHWTAPPAWVSETPSSSMRVAQWRIPSGAGGDASLAVFFFGGREGGSVDANLERWYGQFTQPDGRQTRDVAHRTERTVRGLHVTIADISGTFADTMPGGGGAGSLANHRMLGAIVETPGGMFFAKLLGSTPAVGSARAGFDAWIGSLSWSAEPRAN